MKTITYILGIMLLTSCCSDHDKGLFYVIKPSDLTKDSLENSDSCFYGFHNFVLYNDTTIYYHNLPSKPYFRCGTGLDFSKPSFLDLNTDNTIEIPFGRLEAFWRDSILLSDREKRFITISSTTDTIRNKALITLLKLSDFSKKNQLNIRKCTEEQLFVAEAKFKKQSYSAQKCEWKIGFDDGQLPHEQVILRFLPPVEN